MYGVCLGTPFLIISFYPRNCNVFRDYENWGGEKSRLYWTIFYLTSSLRCLWQGTITRMIFLGTTLRPNYWNFRWNLLTSRITTGWLLYRGKDTLLFLFYSVNLPTSSKRWIHVKIRFLLFVVWDHPSRIQQVSTIGVSGVFGWRSYIQK